MGELNDIMKKRITDCSVLYVTDGSAKAMFCKSDGYISWKETFPDDAEVIEVDDLACVGVNLCYIISSGENYVVHVWRDKGDTPAYECEFKKSDLEVDFGPEISGLFNSNQVEVCLYAESGNKKMDSAAILEWDGSKYFVKEGNLGNWIVRED